MTADAVPTKQARPQRALLSGLVGVVVIGLGLAAFFHFDQLSKAEGTLGGTVTNTWRERGGFVYCQVRLSDGVVINEQCDNLPVGAQVTVDRFRRQLSGRAVYGAPRRDK